MPSAEIVFRDLKKKSLNIAIWPKTPRRRIGASADIFGIDDVVYGEQIRKLKKK